MLTVDFLWIFVLPILLCSFLGYLSIPATSAWSYCFLDVPSSNFYMTIAFPAEYRSYTINTIWSTFITFPFIFSILFRWKWGIYNVGSRIWYFVKWLTRVDDHSIKLWCTSKPWLVEDKHWISSMNLCSSSTSLDFSWTIDNWQTYVDQKIGINPLKLRCFTLKPAIQWRFTQLQ